VDNVIKKRSYNSNEYSRLIDEKGNKVGEILPNQPITLPTVPFKVDSGVRLQFKDGYEMLEVGKFYQLEKPKAKRKAKTDEKS
jgi:hypothetical protein